LWDNVIAGPWGWPRSTVLTRVPARHLPLGGSGHLRYANRVNFQLRNATPRWHGSVGHDAPQNPVRVVASPGRRFRVLGGRGAWMALAAYPCGFFGGSWVHELGPSRVRVSAVQYKGHLIEA